MSQFADELMSLIDETKLITINYYKNEKEP